MEGTAKEKSPRIEIIDVLRGFTLLGIILVHFTEQYYAGQPPEAHQNYGNHIASDPIVAGIIGIFISGKFYMIFSFLFGLSFFIQLNKSDQHSKFLVRFAWRLVVLFTIGYIHHVHYRGDILTIYAMLGIVLLLCFKLPDRILLIVSMLLVLNVPSIVSRAIEATQPTATGASIFQPEQKPLEIYYDTLKNGSYFDIIKANVSEFSSKMKFQIEFGRLYITMGLFLLGLYAGRHRIFSDIDLFKRLTRLSLWTLLGCVVVAVSFFGGMQLAKVELRQSVAWLVGGAVFDVANAALATIYVSVIVRLFQGDVWKRRLMLFYSVGRMGLTTYLMQTMFGCILFFSYGLGMLGEIGTTVCAVIGIFLFVFQILFSNYWLKNFQYGPVEWIWRSLTYLKIQPMKKQIIPGLT